MFSGSWTTFLNLLRCTGGEDELSSVSSKSKTVKKPQSFAPDELLQVRVQLSRFIPTYMLHHQCCLYRMEARIEAVEEELRQEKRKKPSQSSRNGKKAKSTSSGDSASGSQWT